MLEESNQIQETENVFSDVTEEENLFEEEAEETTETPEETKEQNPFLKITYNGEDFDLNEEDARTLAQKGKNYDKIYEPLQRLTRMHGLNTVGELLNMLNDTEVQYQISNEVEKMREDPKYADVSDEILEEIAAAKVNESISDSDKKYEQEQKETADAESARVSREIEKFFKEYPEFRDKGPEALDPKVFDYTKEGYTLLEAYNKWLKETPQQKASRLNEENKRKSLGNTTNAGKTEADDFLNGFLKG